jgi:hypothetical protein
MIHVNSQTIPIVPGSVCPVRDKSGRWAETQDAMIRKAAEKRARRAERYRWVVRLPEVER